MKFAHLGAAKKKVEKRDGVRWQFGAARPTLQSRNYQRTATHVIHVSIVSLLVNDVCEIAVPSPTRSSVSLRCRPYLSCRGSLPLALGFKLPRGSGYGFYVVAGCDGQNRLAARCPATTRPLIERCDLDRCVRTRRRGRLLGC
jgi:hypothetical protein